MIEKEGRWFFHLSMSLDRVQPYDDRTVIYRQGGVILSADNMHPIIRQTSVVLAGQGEFEIFLIGHPAVDDQINDDAVLALLQRGLSSSLEDELVRLNGSFAILIVNHLQQRILSIVDRFSSIPLFWHWQKGRLDIASNLSVLRSVLPMLAVDDMAAAEFLYLRRLMGEKTLLKNAYYQRSASLVLFEPDNEPISSVWWYPDFSLPPLPDKDLPDVIGSTLQSAMSLYLSDRKKVGLLLSGGLDSRALVAASPTQLYCYTTCMQENNESDVARDVAATAGMPFTFLPRKSGILNDYFETAAFLTGGQQIYSECQFMGYGDRLSRQCDVLLIGLGLDIFFGGLYLPSRLGTLFGRPVIHSHLLPLGSDLPETYLNNVSYRLKQSDFWSLVLPNSRQSIEQALLRSVGNIEERGRSLGAEGYTLWEYFHGHNLSRHYSFPMMMSVRSFMDCRAPALENNIFDLSWRMTGRQKLNGTAYQKALVKLAPELMSIRNANTNYPAGMSLSRQTFTKAMQFAKHKVFGSDMPRSPSRADRSWPTAKSQLAASPRLEDRYRFLPQSEALAGLSFLNMDAISEIVATHDRGAHDHAVLINLLLSLECFLLSSQVKH
ncbi:asparagine synthase-related protein [Thalassospira lucentensis]|uniref:asparagine synthase-related protein n=1 Tax=Thalassospira lucentensis TaxID=168935 RepID=UPI003D2EF6CA